VNWEGTLNANAIRNLTDCESLANSITLATDYYTLENLKAALATFDNTNMDLELIASTELWDVFAQRGCIYGVKNVHIRILLSFLLSTRFGGADCVLCHSHAQNRKSSLALLGARVNQEH
jgi:hypothetical protein